MKKSEVLKLLTIASAFDNRRPTDEQVDAWHAVIGDLEFGLAEVAIKNHFQTSDRWLMPVHIVDGVAAIKSAHKWDIPRLRPDELQLCLAANVSPEEFVERREDQEWVNHLKAKWLGIPR